jgi:hypothetical protein
VPEGGAGDNQPNDKAMQEWICHENIARLRRQLETTVDERQRATLLELLAEQEANLKRLRSTPKR